MRNLFLDAEDCLCGLRCDTDCVSRDEGDIPLGVGSRLDTTPPGVPVKSRKDASSMGPGLALEIEECIEIMKCVDNCGDMWDEMCIPPDIPLGVGRRLDTTPPGVPVKSQQDDTSMGPGLAIEVDECVRNMKCVGNCGEICDDMCTPPDIYSRGLSVRKDEDMRKETYEWAQGLKYCPIMDMELPRCNLIPYKAGTSKTTFYRFSFGKTEDDETMAMKDKDTTTMMDTMETVSAVGSMEWEGSRNEDPPAHGILDRPALTTLTLPEKGWEGWGGAVLPYTGGTEGPVGGGKEEGGEVIDMKDEQFSDMNRVKTLIMDWESRGEEEGRGELTYQLKGGEGGGGERRKSQIFLDLCGKFDDVARKKESEHEDIETSFVQQSEEPDIQMGMSILGRENSNYNYQESNKPTYPTFTHLKFETDNYQNYQNNYPREVRRNIVWKQRKLSFGNTGLSLAETRTNIKRKGGEDISSAPKRVRN